MQRSNKKTRPGKVEESCVMVDILQEWKLKKSNEADSKSNFTSLEFAKYCPLNHNFYLHEIFVAKKFWYRIDIKMKKYILSGLW